jgi:hypothetical protein
MCIDLEAAPHQQRDRAPLRPDLVATGLQLTRKSVDEHLGRNFPIDALRNVILEEATCTQWALGQMY